jgi:hypothetical protein
VKWFSSTIKKQSLGSLNVWHARPEFHSQEETSVVTVSGDFSPSSFYQFPVTVARFAVSDTRFDVLTHWDLATPQTE